jgi:hypothetical protein
MSGALGSKNHYSTNLTVCNEDQNFEGVGKPLDLLLSCYAHKIPFL